jgi:protein-tyrosine phosphatase
MKILMVCLGNICRSPIADGLLRKKVADQGLDCEVDSAGTSAFHVGEGPDKRMTKTAANKGVDISFLKARQFVKQDFQDFDIIFAMDQSNYDNILMLASSEADKEKVKMMLNETYPNENLAVPDPYWGGDEGFEEVYDLLDEATNKVIENYLSK